MSFRDAEQWFYAIRERNIDGVRENVSKFAGSRTSRGDTGLMLAARLGIQELVFILASYEKGYYNHDGDTALKIALDAHNFPCIDELLHYELHLKTGKGSTPLHVAVQQNLLGYIPVFVRYWKNTPDASGMSALDLAAKLGHDDAVAYLIQHGSFRSAEIEHARGLAKDLKHHTLAQDITTMTHGHSDSPYSEPRRALTSLHRRSRVITGDQSIRTETSHVSQQPDSVFSFSSKCMSPSRTTGRLTSEVSEVCEFNCPRCEEIFQTMNKRLKELTAEYKKVQEELAELRAQNNRVTGIRTALADRSQLSTYNDINAADTHVPNAKLPFVSFDSDSHRGTDSTSFSVTINTENPQSSMLTRTAFGNRGQRDNYSGRIESTHHFTVGPHTRTFTPRQAPDPPIHSPEYSRMMHSPSKMQQLINLRSTSPERSIPSALNRQVSPVSPNTAGETLPLRPMMY